ncbi:hypothetical protein TIFTF001_015759 [Ficus carica]|uniref:Uncharacterized protein n=1 Tax=Ficus carica TaxID=3494 RepID=A0AA88A526_FICCA|nr:hypothetical protein TIFTF001_015759 [Ficus carica]
MLRPNLGSTLAARRLGRGLWTGQQGCSPNSPTRPGGRLALAPGARRLGRGLWTGQQGCSPNSPTRPGGRLALAPGGC